MKYLMLIPAFVMGIVVIGCTGGNNQGVPGEDVSMEGAAEIVFATSEHNFGRVTEGEKVACIFKFENMGTADLIIIEAIASCGCTVPDFDKKPVQSGQGGNIEVIFDTSNYEGVQYKTIQIKTNATESVVILSITADIITNN